MEEDRDSKEDGVDKGDRDNEGGGEMRRRR
jgi:hypothetical protein